MAISDDLQFVADQDDGIPRPQNGGKFYSRLDSVVCIFPRLEPGSQVPGDFKARTFGYRELLHF